MEDFVSFTDPNVILNTDYSLVRHRVRLVSSFGDSWVYRNSEFDRIYEKSITVLFGKIKRAVWSQTGVTSYTKIANACILVLKFNNHNYIQVPVNVITDVSQYEKYQRMFDTICVLQTKEAVEGARFQLREYDLQKVLRHQMNWLELWYYLEKRPADLSHWDASQKLQFVEEGMIMIPTKEVEMDSI